MYKVKSAGAVFAGFLVVVVLSTGTDWVLETAGFFPKISDQGLFVTWMLALALLYRTIYTIFGGFVTSFLAPERPMYLVYVLGTIGTLGGISGVVAGWNLSDHWYPIALAVLAFPSVWLGGWIQQTFFASLAPKSRSTVSAKSQEPLKEITMTRIFDSNRQKVWDAWTKPEYFAQWFGVPPVTPTKETTTMDLRAGGKWRADMKDSVSGAVTPFYGTYIDVQPPSKLVFTIESDSKPDPEKVTLTFIDRTGTTEMKLHQMGSLPQAQYGESLRNGYNACFERMIAVLQRM